LMVPAVTTQGVVRLTWKWDVGFAALSGEPDIRNGSVPRAADHSHAGGQ
jgi:hypothetical protein